LRLSATITALAASREFWTGEPCSTAKKRCLLSGRLSVRRFTRLTNGFSKRLENLKSAVSLHFSHYNFVRLEPPG
jgi:hypothetical protein